MGCKWKVDSSTAGPLPVSSLSSGQISHSHLIHFQFYVCDLSIIFCDARGFSIWDVPPLHAFRQTPRRVNDFIAFENLAKTFPLPNQGRQQTTLFSQSSWETIDAASPNHHLCFLDPEPANEQLSLYSVRHIGRPDDCFLPTFLPVLAGKSPSIYGDSSHRATTAWPSLRASELIECDNHLVFCSMSHQYRALITTVVPIPKTPPQAVIGTWSKILTGPFSTLLKVSFGFCPVSGRLVYLSGTEGDSKLHVSDLLSIADGSV